jgi:hypothetical protein
MFGMIVKPDSSDPGLASDPIPIDSDHIAIVKPANRESESYQLVCNFILGRTSTGNQGVAMMHLAERKKDPVMAATALQQIETALAVTHAGGHTPNAAYYEARLAEARALLDRLHAH